MQDIDLRLLRYFITVVDHSSFTSAANALNVTQPALSQGIKRLEDLIGSELIVRAQRGSPRAIAPTKAGQNILEDSRLLLAQAESLIARAMANAKVDTLRIGFGASTPRDLPKQVFEIANSNRGVEVQFVYVTWGTELDALQRGAVDAVFVQASVDFDSPKYNCTKLVETGRFAVFRADHTLSNRPFLELAELNDEPIIDADNDRDYWIVNPRPNGKEPKTVGPRASKVDEMLTFVSMGMGMAITCSGVAEKNQLPDLRFIPITDLEPSMIYFVRPHSKSNHAKDRLYRKFESSYH